MTKKKVTKKAKPVLEDLKEVLEGIEKDINDNGICGTGGMKVSEEMEKFHNDHKDIIKKAKLDESFDALVVRLRYVEKMEF